MINHDILRKKSIIELDVEVNLEKLLQEYNVIEKKYSLEYYKAKHWGVKKKYAKSWSGICLKSSDGGLYTDLNGDGGSGLVAYDTELKDQCPYFYQLIQELGGKNCHTRIMRVSPNESIVWHSHVQELNQEEPELVVQIPIIVPKQCEWCIVDKDEWKWYKRFYPRSWFKNIECKRLEAGKAYIFNSYHYHNVFNDSNEYRVTLMMYLDLRNLTFYNLVEKNLKGYE